MLRPNDRLGPYVIDAVAGQGGMGIVYRARDEVLNRTVALKIVHPELLSEGDALPRFVREARIAAELRHPSLPLVYEVSLEGETPYLALEWIDGDTLRQRMAAGRVTTEEAIGLLRGVADVLAYAHARGVVHRDVKPGNVMIGPRGETKLLDFGVAKHAPGADRASALTFDTLGGAVFGTPRYMAPEQMASEPLDGRADQFSWGAMAFELLTGRSPALAMRAPTDLFPFQRPMPCADAMNAPTARLRAIAAVVDRALSPAQAERFPSMATLLEAWDRAASSEIPTAPPPVAPITAAAAPPVAARSLSFALALGGTLTLGLAIMAGVLFWVRRKPAADVTDARPTEVAPGDPSSAPMPLEPTDVPTPTAATATSDDASSRARPPTSSTPRVAPAPTPAAVAPASDRDATCQCMAPPPHGFLCPPSATGEWTGRCVATGWALCHTPWSRDGWKRCADDRYPLGKGEPCEGYKLDVATPIQGKLETYVPCKNHQGFAGPPGRPCEGYSFRDRTLVSGTTQTCPPKR